MDASEKGQGFWNTMRRHPSAFLGLGGWFLPGPVQGGLVGAATAELGGRGIQRLGQTLMRSADPLHRVLASEAAPGHVKRLVSVALDKFQRGDQAGYRAAGFSLLSKAATREWLGEAVGEPVEGES